MQLYDATNSAHSYFSLNYFGLPDFSPQYFSPAPNLTYFNVGAAFSCDGNLSAVGGRNTYCFPSIICDGNLSAIGSRKTYLSPSFVCDGDILATVGGKTSFFITPSFTFDGDFSVTGGRISHGAASIICDGDISAVGGRLHTVSIPNIVCDGNLSVGSAGRLTSQNVYLSFDGVLNANGGLTIYDSASFICSGDLFIANSGAPPAPLLYTVIFNLIVSPQIQFSL